MSGRPHSPGLKYFPVDVDIFRNGKILDLKEDYRSEGLLFYLQLLSTIYSKGHYIIWDRSANRDFRQAYEYTDAQIKQYIDTVLKVDLLSKEVFEKYNVLTSDAIQERYLYSTKKRERIYFVEEYLLIKFENFRSIPQPIVVVDVHGEFKYDVIREPDPKYTKKSLRKDQGAVKAVEEKSPPKAKVVIPEGFERDMHPSLYYDEALTQEVLDLFSLGGMYRSIEKSLFTAFTTVLNNKGQLDNFREQFKAYKEFQLLQNKEYIHIFENFIGHQSERFEDGKWAKTNWQDKLKTELSKSKNKNGHTKSKIVTTPLDYGKP